MKLSGKYLKLLSVAWLFLAAVLLKAGTCQAVARAYITNNSDNTVSVIDTVTQAVLTPLSGFNQPYGVAIAPDADFLYVTNRGENSISQINLATGLEENRTNAGPDPIGVAVSPDGTKCYVANHDLASPGVTIITWPDSDSGTTLALEKIQVGTRPSGVAVNPAGTQLYVTDQSTDELHIVTLATEAVKSVKVGADDTNFPGPHGPRGVAVSPDGLQTVVANYLSGTVTIRNTATGTQRMVKVGYGPFGVVFSHDSSKIYVTNTGDDTVSIIILASFTANAVTIPVGDGPEGISITPNGKFVYVVNNLAGTVSVIETATDTVVNTISVGASPVGFGTFIDGPPPLAPTDLMASLQADTTVALEWTDNATDEFGYKVQRKKYIQGGYVTVTTLPPDSSRYVDSGLDREATYYYRVLSYNDEAESSSNVAFATTPEEDYGCFIATAAYGSLLEPHVVLLRSFRDHFLTGNRPGRAFLRFYYKNSPPLARFIAAHDILRFLVRWSLLPLVGFSWLALSIGLLPALSCLVLAPILLAGLGLYHRKSRVN